LTQSIKRKLIGQKRLCSCLANGAT